MPIIVFVILCWPFIEIAGFIYVGEHIGILATIGLTLLSSFVGAMLLRIQGLAVLRKLQTDVSAGRVPAAALGHGAFTAMAGLCLLVTGFVTDIIGLLLFLPPVRSLILALLARNIHVVVRSSTTRTHVVDLDPADWHKVDPATGNPPPGDGSHGTRSLDGPRD